MRPAEHTGVPSVSAVVNRAADLVDPTGADPDVAAFFERFEDRDEPVTAVEDPALAFEEARAAIDVDGVNPALSVAAAVATYLAHRRDEMGGDADDVLTLATRSEWGGSPPPAVAEWLAAQGAGGLQ